MIMVEDSKRVRGVEEQTCGNENYLLLVYGVVRPRPILSGMDSAEARGMNKKIPAFWIKWSPQLGAESPTIWYFGTSAYLSEPVRYI
jgi:hypothetical protein